MITIMLMYYLIIFQILIIFTKVIDSFPSSSIHLSSGSADVSFDGAITTRVIDLNNPEHDKFLQQFNMSLDQLKRIRSTPSASIDSIETNGRYSDVKHQRYQDIRYKIENVLNGTAIKGNTNLPIHEMAAYPDESTCTQTDESTWQQENNVTINFSANLFRNTHPDMYLDTAVLRLYKLNPHPDNIVSTTNPNSCEDQPIESQIRVTVSTLQQVKRNKRERKKKLCNTVMLNMYQTGWIEIDIKRAISIWKKAQNNNNHNTNSNNNNNNSNNKYHVMVGYLSIEVHDEYEQPLKAGLYFEAPNCAEAYPAIPWNFYRQYSPWASTSMEKVPRYPRLDYKLIDFREFLPYIKHPTIIYDSNHNNKNRNNENCSHSNNNNDNPLLFILTPKQNVINESKPIIEIHKIKHEQQQQQAHHSRHYHYHSERIQNQSQKQQNQNNGSIFTSRNTTLLSSFNTTILT